jgi:hypothetical protein
MVRQGYLDKIKKTVAAPSGSQAGNKNKRGRASKGDQQDSNDSYSWKWGPRAFAEFGESGIVDFVTAFMVEKNELLEQAVEDEEGGREKYQQKRKEEAVVMKKSILKAAAINPVDGD